MTVSSSFCSFLRRPNHHPNKMFPDLKCLDNRSHICLHKTHIFLVTFEITTVSLSLFDRCRGLGRGCCRRFMLWLHSRPSRFDLVFVFTSVLRGDFGADFVACETAILFLKNQLNKSSWGEEKAPRQSKTENSNFSMSRVQHHLISHWKMWMGEETNWETTLQIN